ncbi:MAG TPA: ATP-binding cassette domain-containing protein [Alphaproteobacteria bacterium]|nr:ATP-binding cassette domain-containing protein [Alphaproteobacteria bacterium]
MSDDATARDEGGAGRGWLRPLLKPLRPIFAEIAATSLFINILALAVPVFVLQVYDRVVLYAGFTTLQGLAIGMMVAIVFDFILRQSRSRLLQRVALRFDLAMGQRLFDKLLAVPLRTLESRTAAYWHALFRDTETVRNAFSGGTAVLLADLPFAVIFLAFMFVIAQPVAWVILLMLPVFLFVAWRAASVLRRASTAERAVGYGRDALVTELIAGRTTVKALATGPALRPLWEDRQTGAIEHAIDRGGKTDRYVNMSTGLTVFTTVLLTTVGAISIVNKELTIGALIAANILSFRIVGPFQQLVGNWRNMISARDAAVRLGEAFTLAEDRQADAVSADRPKGKLTFEDLTFGYTEDGPPAVDQLNVKMGPSGMLGIVGKNGSGKSTLLKLALGLYAPGKGRVLLDDADIAQYGRAQLAEWIGYVPQECVLFAGTIRSNLAQRDALAGDEEIVRAAKTAGLHSYVIDLPDGYDTDIGEAGARLSAGIRQRIAVARALVGDPPIVLLDEPSSNLDRQAQEELTRSLATLARDHTILVVTHSQVLLTACNNIMAMENGKLAMAGPTAEVLGRLFPNPPTPFPEKRSA